MPSAQLGLTTNIYNGVYLLAILNHNVILRNGQQEELEKSSNTPGGRSNCSRKMPLANHLQ